MSRISQVDKTPRKRAVLERDKVSKRSSIIQAAASLLSKKDLADLSMDEVAKRAKIAKGTLYLYFPTKEDLYLKVHILDYKNWFEDLISYLEDNQKTKPNFLDWFVSSFERHPRFVKILPVVPTILEKNASIETIKEYKTELLNHLNTVIPLLTLQLGLKSDEETFLFMMQCHAIAIGSWSHGFPSPAVKQVLNDKELNIFLVDYQQFIRSSVATLLKGYLS
ncbi:MAG: TetR family transcriptional regulator [Leptospira sp.]|nr:TetR family transcriptional regulator [Leptospira sp.]